MTIFLALFRGINVNGRVVKMDMLKELHASLGFTDVITYIQSGNVIFTSNETDSLTLTQRIEEGFQQKFGFRSSVIIRTVDELQQIIDNTPFHDQPEKEPKWIVVTFFSSPPREDAVEQFQKLYQGPEELYLKGRDLYTYYPESIGHSKLPAHQLSKILQADGTARNWNTILKLQKLMA
ncbi:DUF1697 domain-containing protein [Tengunoibacter tsumagoiensis]|uniref:DUF1697 domain-containing protein n=1 Tax=Tengunoibacter tsumagoiensis TaxID=2014871 RepID=A0A402A9K4_9CHLR|nr:DUF1697 domain-containing protein [Tengunoibacter tsumagoiensis]GCE15864.1 hypothetical protein KTT_57230 [Tengunoibacter tsumagoiensis]